jgi:hypothetical protein
MPVWRCPHCATPQAEASRCWVCRRSTTSCVTCRHYRRAITGGLGLCGLDPRHPAVADTEVRACWVGMPASAAGVAVGPGPLDWLAPDGGSTALNRRTGRTFVPVEAVDGEGEAVAVAVLARLPVAPATMPEGAEADPAVPVAPSEERPIPGRWWLWGDPEPWPER